jgi:hypothetical protein
MSLGGHAQDFPARNVTMIVPFLRAEARICSGG